MEGETLNTAEEKLRAAGYKDAFTTAFGAFISECERADLRIDSVTFREIKRPTVTVTEVAKMWGIPLMVKEVS
jgi:hypothetical protein